MNCETGDFGAGGLCAGWAKVDFTPSGTVPLAGYTHLSDRMSTGVHDPLFARAVVLKQEGGPAVGLVVFDLVIITEDLYQGVKARLADTGLKVLCAATHTHSAPGGFWKAALGRAFLGRFRDGALEHMAQIGAEAIRKALDKVAPVSVSTGTVIVPGLNGNRRDHAGAVDEELQIIRLSKDGSDAVLFSYPGHPVIAAERDHNVISADFPGLACSRIERDFDFAMYLAGALGGVDVKFPQTPVSIDENLEMMAAPLAGAAVSLAHSAADVSSRPLLSWAGREIRFDRPFIRWSYDDDRKPFDFLLDAAATALAKPVPRIARIEGFRLGDMVVIGFPADLGIGLSLRIKEMAKRLGLRNAITMSQSGGCVGYVHHPDDYRRTPADEGEAIQMGRYENAMNFFGHDTGLRFLDAAAEVMKDLV